MLRVSIRSSDLPGLVCVWTTEQQQSAETPDEDQVEQAQ
jgi:hypothetical protein